MSTTLAPRPQPLAQNARRLLECGHTAPVSAMNLSTWCPACREEQLVAG